MPVLYVSLWTDVSIGQIPRRTIAEIKCLSIFNKYWQKVFPKHLAIYISPARCKEALPPKPVTAPCTDLAWTSRHSPALSVMFRCLSLAFKTLHNMKSSEHAGIIPPYCSVLQKPFTYAKVVALFLKPNLSCLMPYPWLKALLLSLLGFFFHSATSLFLINSFLFFKLCMFFMSVWMLLNNTVCHTQFFRCLLVVYSEQ